MRYYEYLSLAKVDMLFPQLDQSSRAAETEIGLDLKVLKFSRKTTGGQEPLTAYEKLSKVEDWIYAHEPVGRVDEPAAWIYGRMRLAMTVVSKDWQLGGRPFPEAPLEDGTALFAGRDEEGALIIMGGSACHLVNLQALQVANVRWSQVGSSALALGHLLRYYSGFDDPAPAGRSLRAQPCYQDIARPASDILRSVTGRSHGGHGASFNAVDGEFEFLARRLQTEMSGKRIASLATPLFVARID